MKRLSILLLATVALPLLAAACSTAPASDAAGTSASTATKTYSDEDKQWTMQNKNYASTRYSGLDTITAANVKNLKVAWTFSTGVLRGHEGGPLVVGSTMYVHTPFPNIVYALDLTKEGAPIKWKYVPKQDPKVIPVACCDTVNRGLAYANGKIFQNQLDTTTVALDAETGKELWKVKQGDYKRGETITAAPLVIKDKVISGVSGGEFGVRGFVTANDVNTGKQVWRMYSTGPESEVGFPGSEETWKGDEWKRGGGTTWGWYSYDPDLNLLYYGSGNPGSWNPDQRPGDNKWSMTIFARNPDTGEAKWAYQMTPWDAWDFDGINEHLLTDLTVGGKKVKALIHFDRNGFGYTLRAALDHLPSGTANELVFPAPHGGYLDLHGETSFDVRNDRRWIKYGGEVGGSWGRSIVNLAPYAHPKDKIQLRFDIGNDGCTGVVGWYIDDLLVYSCK
jgi:alcohol dehydrogenase (cytochrome c)